MTPTQYRHGPVVVAFTAILLCAGANQGIAQDVGRAMPDAVDNDSPRSVQDVLRPETVQPAGSPLPDMPRVRLAPMPGFDDDSAYIQSIAGRVSELTALADKADDPIRRVGFLLAAANLILAHQIEPGCTKRLLHIHDDRDKPDEAALRSALDRADALMMQADTALNKLHDRDDSLRDRLQESTHRLETLQAFASGQRAYLLPDESAEAARELRRAASRLSPLLEEKSRTVVAAATLWQACLRGRESNPAPALSVLGSALADPPPGSMPYAFFARLLRCRLIAARGGPPTALALLMQIEKRSDEWFTDDRVREEAVRAARLLRIQILADWHDRLGSSGSASERQWCVERMKALVGEHFGDDTETLLRLTPAIPLLASAPEAKLQIPERTPEGS